ncbi:MAG: hypothetical protein QXU98_03830 [Candidatus Parvarchaeota archaeon]
MSFAEQITLHTTVKAEPPPQAPVITVFQRARTRERNRTILPNQAVVYYMSSFAQLGVNTINANQSQLLQQYQGVPVNVTNLPPTVANEVYTTANPNLVPVPNIQQTIPTTQQIINNVPSKTVILRNVYQGTDPTIIPPADQGTIIQSIIINNGDYWYPIYVNGILIPPGFSLTITVVDPNSSIDPSTLTVQNPYKAPVSITYMEVKK